MEYESPSVHNSSKTLYESGREEDLFPRNAVTHPVQLQAAPEHFKNPRYNVQESFVWRSVRDGFADSRTTDDVPLWSYSSEVPWHGVQVCVVFSFHFDHLLQLYHVWEEISTEVADLPEAGQIC